MKWTCIPRSGRRLSDWGVGWWDCLPWEAVLRQTRRRMCCEKTWMLDWIVGWIGYWIKGKQQGADDNNNFYSFFRMSLPSIHHKVPSLAWIFIIHVPAALKPLDSFTFVALYRLNFCIFEARLFSPGNYQVGSSNFTLHRALCFFFWAIYLDLVISFWTWVWSDSWDRVWTSLCFIKF